MKTILPLLAVALLGAPAVAQNDQAQEGIWPVQAAGASCTMKQSFTDPDYGLRTLVVSYDAARQEVSLSTTNAAMSDLSDSGVLWLRIMFLDNQDEEQDDAWGMRRFSYARNGESYRFETRFLGEKNVRQILADLAASRGVGFLDRSEVVTAYDLSAADDSLARLRACAARAVASN